MSRTKRIFGLGSFFLSDEERKEVHRYLMMQLQGKLPRPIENLTLNKYFELVKEILEFTDQAFVLNGFSKRFGYEDRLVNFKDMEPEEVARRTMDGRQMFYSDYGHPEGVLADRDHDSPEEFKWWLFNYVHLGHPWETSVGNFNPGFLWKQGYNHKNVGYDKKNYQQYASNKWVFYFSRCHRNTVYAMRAFIRLRKLGYPVIWDQGEYDLRELTKKYFVDLSEQPNWYDMDETTYDMLINKFIR